jgi:hypothetical protein
VAVTNLWTAAGGSGTRLQAVGVLQRSRPPDGVFIGTHALAEGRVTRKQLHSGLYRRLHPNVYADCSIPDSHRLRARGAALLLPPGAAIGGRSAAAWYEAPFSSVSDPVVVVAPRGCAWDGPRGVRVHKTDLAPAEVVLTEDDVPITTALRTAWEVATLEQLADAVALLDGMVFGKKLTEGQIAQELLGRRGRWGSRRAADVVPLVDGGAMSPPESWVRVACLRAGLPRPLTQHVVVERGVWLAQVDLAWPEAKLVVEYEGPHHFEELQIAKDDRRYLRLVAAGWRVIRLSAADLRDLGGVVERIRAALEEVPGAR